MKKIIVKIFLGISLGCTIFVLVEFIGLLINENFLKIMSVSDFVKNVICTIIAGIGFSLPALAYKNDKLSRGMQVLIHMGTGFAIYLPLAFIAGWIPVSFGFWPIILCILVTLTGAFAIWLCFYLYNKNSAKAINAKIKEKQGQ